MEQSDDTRAGHLLTDLCTLHGGDPHILGKMNKRNVQVSHWCCCIPFMFTTNMLILISDQLLQSMKHLSDSQPDHEDNRKVPMVKFSGCLAVQKEVAEMLRPFYIMKESKEQPKLFTLLWEKNVEQQLNDCAKNRDGKMLTLVEVYKLVWLPAYEECEYIIEKLSTLQIPLQKVNQYFICQEVDDLNNELTKLAVAITNCRMNCQPSFLKPDKENSVAIERNTFGQSIQWIPEAVDRIKRYERLSHYKEAAETFLLLRKKLNLKGDFDVVEALCKRVSDVMDWDRVSQENMILDST